MKKKIWRLTVQSEFSAGHALRHYEGKCENLHGHNFSVEITVEGEQLLPKQEFIIDFKILKGYLKSILSNLDHSVLNEREPFSIINPSSENIAYYIWKHLENDIKKHEIKLYSVKISEKSEQSVTFMEIDCD